MRQWHGTARLAPCCPYSCPKRQISQQQQNIHLRSWLCGAFQRRRCNRSRIFFLHPLAVLLSWPPLSPSVRCTPRPLGRRLSCPHSPLWQWHPAEMRKPCSLCRSVARRLREMRIFQCALSHGSARRSPFRFEAAHCAPFCSYHSCGQSRTDVQFLLHPDNRARHFPAWLSGCVLPVLHRQSAFRCRMSATPLSAYLRIHPCSCTCSLQGTSLSTPRRTRRSG